MTPVYPSSSFVEKEEDQKLQLYIFSSPSSQLAYATCFSAQHDDQRGHRLEDHKAAEKSAVNNETTEGFDDRSKSENGSAAKNWMSSKMRLMQKMMIETNKKSGGVSDHKPSGKLTQNLGNHRCGKWGTRSCSSNNNGVRVCSDCNTTTTPLWRSGPQGPKSLCNACGIRQRKARRAMAEAANPPLEKQNKEKKSQTSCHGDDVVSHQSKESVSFENFTVSLRKTSSGFRGVFPRDEEEAAILLMELSCGLVHSF